MGKNPFCNTLIPNVFENYDKTIVRKEYESIIFVWRYIIANILQTVKITSGVLSQGNKFSKIYFKIKTPS